MADRMDVKNPIILGVDPGLNITGYGVIQALSSGIRLIEAGVIRTKPRESLSQRLHELHSGLQEVIQSAQPHVMALEQLYSHYQRPRTAILMGHARGVICLAAAQAGIEVENYEPTKVKKLITGNGHASKAQMQLAIKLQLSLAAVPDPPDVADALAIALCHCQLQGKQVKL